MPFEPDPDFINGYFDFRPSKNAATLFQFGASPLAALLMANNEYERLHLQISKDKLAKIAFDNYWQHTFEETYYLLKWATKPKREKAEKWINDFTEYENEAEAKLRAQKERQKKAKQHLLLQRKQSRLEQETQQENNNK